MNSLVLQAAILSSPCFNVVNFANASDNLQFSGIASPAPSCSFGGGCSRDVGSSKSSICVKKHGLSNKIQTPRGKTSVPGAVSTSLEVSCSSQSLAERFAELKSRGEVAVIPFIVAGDPDLETTEEVLLALNSSGADVIELGVPYSDPLADGPVIQAAATRALAKGTDLNSVLALLSKVSPRLSAPVVLFTYYNPIMKRGPEKFFQDAKAAGAAGLVIPDIPLEETPPLRQLATENGLELVLLTTPTTPVARMAAIADAAQGFLYLVSLTGVTGARSQVESRVERLLQEIKEATDKPVAVGFGISTAEHATQVAQWGADGVIVGSKVVSLLAGAETPKAGVEAVAALIRILKKAVNKDLQIV